MSAISCPKCGKDFIRRTVRHGLRERLLGTIYVYPFRCQLCTTQFRAFWPSPPDASREFDRREFKRLPASFQAKVLTELTTKSDHRLTDISMGGCTIETASALPKGTFLELLIKPASDEEMIKVETAMVCSVRSESVGVQFLEFQPDDQLRLSQVVLSLWVGQSLRPNSYS